MEDEINIDYSSLLVKEMCSDPDGKKCNLNSLTRKYNGRNNLKYKNKLESLLSEFNKIYG